MDTNKMELNMNELEMVNGGGLVSDDIPTILTGEPIGINIGGVIPPSMVLGSDD